MKSPEDAGERGPKGVMAWATDPFAAERLWTLSENLTGVTLAAGGN
jgi:hypothetical protein